VEALLRGEREPRRLALVIGDRERVVEEDHDPVAGEVLERSSVLGDQPAERGVVFPQHLEELLGRSGLGERREAAKIAEEA
jgi:hypothetical protein